MVASVNAFTFLIVTLPIVGSYHLSEAQEEIVAFLSLCPCA